MGAEPGAAALNGHFSGREPFSRLLRGAFERAAGEGWTELLISDATFEDWPLAEVTTVQSLQAWARPGRRLVMLADRFDRVLCNQPRFTAWRKMNSHVIDCRLSPKFASDAVPSAVCGPDWFLQRTDLEACAGVYGVDRRRWTAVRENLQMALRTSRPGFPVTTLGL